MIYLLTLITSCYVEVIASSIPFQVVLYSSFLFFKWNLLFRAISNSLHFSVSQRAAVSNFCNACSLVIQCFFSFRFILVNTRWWSKATSVTSPIRMFRSFPEHLSTIECSFTWEWSLHLHFYHWWAQSAR